MNDAAGLMVVENKQTIKQPRFVKLNGIYIVGALIIITWVL